MAALSVQVALARPATLQGSRQHVTLALRQQQKCTAAAATTAARPAAQPRRGRRPAASAAASSACSSPLDVLSDPNATAEQLLAAAEALPLPELMAAARSVRDAHYSAITFSPKVFIPLTRLCRDSCGYCTFATPPAPGRRAYMTLEEVLAVARLGAEQGCTEALFTLGDKPELAYPQAAAELAANGYASTLEYVAAAAAAVLRETGLLPHVNAGVMGRQELRALKAVSASQGLMLESTSEALLEPGGAHHACPDKQPGVRLATLEAAGRERVPFTSGLLIGIGESRMDRVEALLALRRLHAAHGHIQEVIIQNFVPKQGTAMAGAPRPPLSELLWTVALARLLLGPGVSLQAPPNLTPEPDDVSAPAGGLGAGSAAAADPAAGWRLLLDAGINDWGGISPVTRDYVSPERPWPHLRQLAAATAAAGFPLLPRLPVYPSYLQAQQLLPSARPGQQQEQPQPWLDAAGGRDSVAAAVLRLADGEGLARGSTWFAGVLEGEEAPQQQAQQQQQQQQQQQVEEPGRGQQGAAPPASAQQAQQEPAPRSPLKSSTPAVRRRGPDRTWRVAVGEDGLLEGCEGPAEPSPQVQRLLAAVLEGGRELQEGEVQALFAARGADFRAVCAAADQLRQRVCGDTVTFVVNRNINYTNVCTYACSFCAFSKGKAAEEVRGAPYLLPLEEVARRTAEAWDRGATEVCMQGGIHPDFNGDSYLRLLGAAKAAAPDMHVHAFSPLEVSQGAATLGWPLARYLAALRDAGLGSLPGTAAEVLDDGVRGVLCPDKLSTQQWLEVVETAHSVGLRTTSTIMFGHVDGPAHWARHLLALRDLQKRTGGLTEFVPLPFVHMEAPLYLKGRARRGPTLRECFLLHAVARLALHPHVPNIQASWVKMGPQRAAQLLAAGCNDMGGVLMNESITRAAGAAHGQQLHAAAMEALIAGAGRVPAQRTTLYGTAPASQAAKARAAGADQPVLAL